MSTTERELTLRLRRLLVLGVVFCATLLASYRGVHDDTEPLADSTAPAVFAVDTAQDALRDAHEAALLGEPGRGAYHAQVSVITQSLALASSENVLGSSGRQRLQAAAGLLSVYMNWVQSANDEQDRSAHLKTAYISYAKDTFGNPESPETSITSELDELQQEQAHVVDRQTGFGRARVLLAAGWAAVGVTGLALLLALLETQRFLRRRFKRRWNLPLLAATALLVLGTAMLATITWRTSQRLARARDLLTQRHIGDDIRTTGEEVTRLLDGSGTQAALADAIVVAAVLLIGLIVAGLVRWLREYPPRLATLRLPTLRAFAIVVLCLVVLASGVTVISRTYLSRGAVTVLAGWRTQDQVRFERTVVAPFEKKYRIDVIFQSTSAASKILAAETRAGTAPDMVVTPGPGELMGYARSGQVVPLEGLVKDSKDFSDLLARSVPGPDGRHHLYWVPIKADVKSLVWHPLVQPNSASLTRPEQWCLGMKSGATSGWPGTDWVEDILLHQAGPDTYQDWATGRLPWDTDPQVRRAFTTWGSLVGAGTDSAVDALTTYYGDAGDKYYEGDGGRQERCWLEHAGASLRVSEEWRRTRTYAPSGVLIPGVPQNRQHDTWEVSSDLAALLRDTPQARQFIGYLASPEVQQAWSRAEHGFPPNANVPRSAYYDDPTAIELAETLRDPVATHCWDASDAMPPVMRDAFTQAVLEYLAAPERLTELLRTLERTRVRANEHEDTVWLPWAC